MSDSLGQCAMIDETTSGRMRPRETHFSLSENRSIFNSVTVLIVSPSSVIPHHSETPQLFLKYAPHSILRSDISDLHKLDFLVLR